MKRDKLDENNAKCVYCKKGFHAKRPELAKYCSKRCAYENNYKGKPPLEKKAITIGANLVMGGDKKAYLMSEMDAHIGTPCTYCGENLTLDNLTFDHKVAYKRTELRKEKAKNRDIRMYMDRPQNLQVICKSCNQLKGELDDDQYRRLVDFLETDPWIKIVINRRLKRSMGTFKRGRRN